MKKWLTIFFLGVCGMVAADKQIIHEQVLDYWFGELNGPADFPIHKSRLWFMKDEAVDRDIRQHFGTAVEAAGKGKYDHWTVTPRGRLALVVLLDQFSRNLHRGKPEAFHNDHKALKLALEGITRGEHLFLYPVERAFLFMPLEHAEDLHYQERCVKLFEELSAEVVQEVKAPFESFLEYAEKHRDVIEQFGRFPHRNATLLRDSSPEEIAFLQESGSGF